MGLSSAKASTQDNTSGTPFATIASEEGTPEPIQGVGLVGNKSTYAELSRTAVTAADAPTSGDLSTSHFAGSAGANLQDLGNALAVAIRATCTVAGTTMSGRVVFYDGSNNPIGYSELVTFTSDGTLRLSASGDYVSQRAVVDAGAGRKAAFLATSVASGSWSVYIRGV